MTGGHPLRRPVSVRTWLMAGLIGVGVYVVTAGAVVSGRVRRDSQHLIAESEDLHAALGYLNDATADLEAIYDQLVERLRIRGPVPVDSVRVAFPDGAALSQLLALPNVSTSVRVAVGSAAEQQTRLTGLLDEALAFIELNERDSATETLARTRGAAREFDTTVRRLSRLGLSELARHGAQLNQLAGDAAASVRRWGFIGVVLVAGIVFLLQHRLYWPLARLDEGLARVARGEWTYRVPVKRWDEVGRLTGQFNRTAQILADHQARAREERWALQTEGQTLAALVEASHDVIALTHLDGQVIYVNPAGLTALGLDDLTHGRRTTTTDYLPEDDRRRIAREIWPALRRRGRWHGEISVQHLVTGVAVPFDIDAFLVSEPSGEPYAIGILARDIRERRRTQAAILALTADLEARVLTRTAELQDANRELEAFSFSVSHDLRAPLRAIEGFTRIVIQEYGGTLPEDARAHLAKVETNTRQMGQLIADLLRFSRLGRQPLTKLPVPLKPLVEEVWSELVADVPHRTIQFACHPLPTVVADATLLRQVLANLLSNAIKFTRTRPNAMVEVGAVDDTTVYVRDNGVGFDMQYVDKLFVVFQRLHAPEEYEGTGVGLALAHRIVLRHKGRLWATSAPGDGATFYFALGEGPDTRVAGRPPGSGPSSV